MDDFWLWLLSVPGVGSGMISRIREDHGSNDSIRSIVERISHTLHRSVSIVGWMEQVGTYKDSLKRNGVKIIPYWSGEYPELLRQIPDYPAFLFCKGRCMPCDLGLPVAVVGTRSMTEYGSSVVSEIVPFLVSSGISVVSGLAYGVDAAVHKQVLLCRGNQKFPCLGNHRGTSFPVAVLPSSPVGGYPVANKRIFDQICQQGVVVWEHLPGVPLTRGLFASRNRIIAGISTAVVVIESRASGGSLITASCALDYNRDVGAVPGSVFSTCSDGTNALIEQGACVVRNGADVLGMLDIGGNFECMTHEEMSPINRVVQSVLGLSDVQLKDLVPVLYTEGVSLEVLAKKGGREIASLRSSLTKLEVEGILRLDSNGTVKLLRAHT